MTNQIPERFQPIIDLYSHAMEEISHRLRALTEFDRVAHEKNLSLALLLEYFHFQIRMILELIAVACLIAHRDVADAKSVAGVWHPKKMFEAIEPLHPDFFPLPEKFETRPDGIIDIMTLTGIEILKKEELPAIHGRCGNWTHRTFATFSKEIDFEREIANVRSIMDKIVRLLDSHNIHLKDSGFVFHIRLNWPHKRPEIHIYRKNDG
jgi:hypothetical protein